MTLSARPQDHFDNMAVRAMPMHHIESSREAEASGTYVEQPKKGWQLPPPVFVNPKPVYRGSR